MSFYPKDHKFKQGGNLFMRLEQGENKIRIMADPAIGYKYWTNKETGEVTGNPMGSDTHRLPFGEKLPKEAEEKAKDVLGLIVYNYNTEEIQLLEVTQVGIMKTIRTHSEMEDYGDPKGYDFTIIRDGEGLKTEYQVIAGVPKKASKELEEAFAKKTIDMKGFFKTGNPFAGNDEAAHDDSDELPFG